MSWTSDRAQTLELFADGRSLGMVSTGSGSKQLAATVTTEYTMKAVHKQGGTGFCAAKLNVKEAPPQSPDPSCTLNTAPISVLPGGTTTLSWTTQHAVKIDVTATQADGGTTTVSTPSASGSVQLTPAQATTYNGTVVNDQGKTASCTASVAITDPPAPTCQIAADPMIVLKGTATNLRWTGSNEAVSIVIDYLNDNYEKGSLGQQPLPGSSVQTIHYGTVFQGTVSGATGKQGTCNVRVDLTEPPPQTGFLLDDSGNVLNTDWIPPCVPPESGEWQCATSPYPPGDKLVTGDPPTAMRTQFRAAPGLLLTIPKPIQLPPQQRGMADIIALPDGKGCLMTLTGPSLQNPAQWTPVNPSDPLCK